MRKMIYIHFWTEIFFQTAITLEKNARNLKKKIHFKVNSNVNFTLSLRGNGTGSSRWRIVSFH